MNKHGAIINWAKNILQYPIIKYEMIVETPYSNVIKIVTDQQIYYLKQTPKSLYLEAEILSLFSDTVPTPKLVAKNDEYCSFLIEECGNKTLRQHLFEKGNNYNLMETALNNYFNIQISTIDHTDEYSKLGVSDWRLNKFCDLYTNLLNDDYFMNIWQISDKQRATYLNYSDDIRGLCEKLLICKLPDTLNHCDFHNNNIVKNEKGELFIIDWGEVCITNPLLSIEPYMRSLRKHHDIEHSTKKYRNIQKSYYERWSINYDRAIKIADPLSAIYFIFCMKNIMELTNETFERWACDVKNAFQDFEDRLNKSI